MLEALERANLFVVPLDDERRWYRYHHLFAEVLRRHLQQREPTLSSELHRRASTWYEQRGLPTEAVQHALAVPDFAVAARLIELIALPLAYQGQIYTVLGWLNALPEALLHSHPRLCVYYAVLLMFTNQLEAALALEALGDRTGALFTLERALVLAAPEGYIRLFVDEGAPMLALLRQAYARGIVPEYVATLLSTFGEQRLSDLALSSARPSGWPRC